MKTCIRVAYLILTIHVIVGASPVWAAPTLHLEPVMEGIQATSGALYLEDPEGTLGFEQVSKESWAQKFSPLPGGSPNFGLSGSAFWIRFEVENRTDESID